MELNAQRKPTALEGIERKISIFLGTISGSWPDIFACTELKIQSQFQETKISEA